MTRLGKLAARLPRLSWGCAAVALVTFLPFVLGTLSGRSFYFRDLSRQFFPLRRFAVEGLLRGEVRYWNPFLHEGIPLSLPALSYLPDLLQLLVPHEAGFSLVLALHVPAGALAFVALARGLGAGRVAAAGGGIIYALGGFYLSCLNLYVYVQAAAWAPLVVLGLLRGAERAGRWQAAAAVAIALALSTTGAEIVLQSIAIGVILLATGREPVRLARAAWSVALGFGLAAPVLLVMRGLVTGSARGRGFPTPVVLAHSVHPLTLAQVVVGNLLGDLGNIANDWWGSNFFPLGFPYFLSLYLGATVLALAAVGALHGGKPRRRLVALAAAATIICLGRWVRLDAVVDALAPLHLFRYPSKAFFTVHLAMALLAVLGLDLLARGGARAWRSLAAIALGLGGLLVAVPALPTLFPNAARWFLAGFLPPDYSWADRAAVADRIVADASLGGWAAVAAGTVALLVLAGRLAPERAALAAVALVACDLLRTGAGLNPMVTSSFYRFSPQMAREAASLRAEGGRLFSCDPESGPAYFLGRRAQPESHDVWTFAAFMETLTPAYNMLAALPTAYSRDLTMLVPEDRVLAPEEVGASAFPQIEARLREAGVAHVVCLEPIDHPSLRSRSVLEPDRVFPLIVRVYDLVDPLPLRGVARGVRPASGGESKGDEGVVGVEGADMSVSGASGRLLSSQEGTDRIEMEVEADRPTMALVRDAFAPGWSAEVNGLPARLLRANGRHRAIPIGAGRSRIVLRFRPPGLSAGLAVAVLAAGLVLATASPWPKSPTRPPEGAA